MGIHCTILSTFRYFKNFFHNIKLEKNIYQILILGHNHFFLHKQIFPDVEAKPVSCSVAVKAKKHRQFFPLT